VSPTDHDWRTALASTIDGTTPPGLALQPIVDLQRGTVVGHEVLARFPGPPAATPDVWFAAAERLGHGPALTRSVVEQAMTRLPDLPADTFLTVNLEPHHVHDADVRAAFLNAGRLDRVILELTEHAQVDDSTALLHDLDLLRAVGARTAIDDAGSGYAGLQALLTLRPDLVKLDRGLVDGLDKDPTKRVLLRALGEIADGIDAWVLGEGVETTGELQELIAAGVPLGQGYLLGRPTPGFTPEVPIEVVRAVLDAIGRRRLADSLVGLMERPAEQVGDLLVFDQDLALEIDAHRRPVALLGVDLGREEALLLAKSSDAVRDVARRVVARRAGRWSDPVVVTDGRGVAAGVVRVARLLEFLAVARTQPAAEATG